MRTFLVVAALCIAAAIVLGEQCKNEMDCMETMCAHNSSVVKCEHDRCTCLPGCMSVMDCSGPCGDHPDMPHHDPHHHGHSDAWHCIDNMCWCGELH